jgi:beta-glucosidase
MVKRKPKSDRRQESDRVLGHDPFEGLDMEWINREEGELSIRVLGQDPFEDLDVEWVYEGADQSPVDELPTEPAQEEAVRVAPAEIEARPIPRVTADKLRPREFTVEQVVVEKFPLEQAVAEVEPTRHPRPAERIQRGRPTSIAATEVLMPAATFHFPADFKWGVATAAHQVEGNNVLNDWWAWEQENGHIKKGHMSGLACDWWDNAEADFDRAAEMGLNALRLSIEWSRVEPRPGVFDDAALQRYGQMLQGLRERGIEPMVTLHHFTSPRWLAEQGGWENPEVVTLFARFTRRVVEALGRHCDLWCTINEPNVYGYMGYLEGVFPPGQSDLKTAMRVIRNMLIAHAAAYREIHALQPDARVGLAHNMRVFDPVTPRSLLDRRAARMTDKVYNQAVLTALTRGWWTPPLGFGLAWKVRGTLDWIGLNYYTRDLVTFDHTQNEALFNRRMQAEGAELLDGGYGEFYPRGMFRCLQRLARLGLPIYVTENGIPDDDDDQRPRYLLSHLHEMWHAIQLCYPVMGYYHWTLVDNFEWAEGWTLRFGLIALDPKTQSRMPRLSADLYTEIVRANAISSRVIDTYAPELRAEMLPK